MIVKLKSLLNNNLAIYALLYGGAAALLKLSGFAIFLFFARKLSTTEYAEFGIMYSLQAAISTFSIAGIVELIIANLHHKEYKVNRKKLIGITNIIYLIFSIIVSTFIYIYYLISNDFNFTKTILIGVVILNAVALTFTMYSAQIVRLDENHKKSLFFSFTIPFFAFFLGFIGFLKFTTITSFFAFSFLGFLIPILKTINLKEASISFDKVQVKNGVFSCVPFIAMAFFNWISGYGNNQILDFLFTSSEIATFTFLYSISALMQLVATALNQVWAPKFYNITHLEKMEIVEKKNYKFYSMMSILLGIVAGIVIIFLPVVTNFIGGNAIVYGKNKLFLFFLLSSYIILTPWWHCQNYFLSHNKGVELFKITTYSTVLGMILSITLMYLVGEIGVYLGFFIVMFLRVVFIVFYSKLYWDLKLSWKSVIIGLSIFFVLSFFNFNK